MGWGGGWGGPSRLGIRDWDLSNETISVVASGKARTAGRHGDLFGSMENRCKMFLTVSDSLVCIERHDVVFALEYRAWGASGNPEITRGSHVN